MFAGNFGFGGMHHVSLNLHNDFGAVANYIQNLSDPLLRKLYLLADSGANYHIITDPMYFAETNDLQNCEITIQTGSGNLIAKQSGTATIYLYDENVNLVKIQLPGPIFKAT